MEQPLRLGVMVDGDTLPLWAVALLEAIAAAGDARIVLVVVNKPGERRDVRELGDWFAARRGAGYRAWMALEYRLFPQAAASFAATPLPKRLAHVPRMDVAVTPDAQESLGRDDLDRLAVWEIDVLLQLGFGALRGGVLGIARFGVWRLRLAGTPPFTAGSPGFWEVVHHAGATGAALEIVAPGDNGFLLAQGAFTSNDHSVLKNRDGAYWAASRWIQRELGAVRRLGEAGFRERLARRALPQLPAGGAGTEPHWLLWPWQFLRTTLLRPLARKLRERRHPEQWVLMFGFVDAADSDLAGDQLQQLVQNFRTIRPPADRFWADPCVIAHEGRWWVFIEELVYAEGKGVLAVLEIFADGTWSAPQRILELPCHLSYPFVFRHGDAFYMIPETAGARAVDLYRAVEFPHHWEKLRTLLPDIVAVDATVIEGEGRWWMFVNVVPEPHLTTQDELWLFSTDDPVEGTWLPHPGNPVVSDATSARPAGRLWYEPTAVGSRLLRPAQNSTGHYGYALKIHEVVQLDDQDYREVCVAEIKPWGFPIVGVHTLSSAGGLTVIDALQRASTVPSAGTGPS